MTDRGFVLGCVITACAGREDNLRRVLDCLRALDERPIHVVVVFDGCPPFRDLPDPGTQHSFVTIAKHEPGHEQPRNVGVRHLREDCPAATMVWFLDGDLVFQPDLVTRYREAFGLAGPRVMMGPYEWLAPEEYEPRPDLHNDIRWPSFRESGPERVLTHDLGAGLGCFSGNLVWPLDEFEHVGGFAAELHHGRCEDGELGLRAASAGVPMSLVRDARAWHVAHNVDMRWCVAANARDVPLLNSWHPWVQDEGLLLTEADGARFDFRCSEPGCGLVVNSHDYWEHVGSHRGREPHYNDPASVRHA